MVSGTLIILITSLFMNACSSLVAYDRFVPNLVVMNTIIASGSSGLCIVLRNHYYNVFIREDVVKETSLLQYYDIH